MKKSFVKEKNFAHENIPKAECVTQPQSHRESLGEIDIGLMYVTRQLTVIGPGHF